MRNYLTRRNDGLSFGRFFDDAFDDFFKPVFYGVKECSMKTDIKETEGGYELLVDMPGFEKKDITLSLENGYLTVQASREEKDESDKYVRRERNYSCSRSFYVGDAVSEEDIKAKYDNGTLNLSVPKKDKKELPKKNIEIE